MTDLRDRPGRAPPAAASARALTKVYGTGRRRGARAATASTSTSPPARFTAIMGPSGSGKSTLMHCLAGLDRPRRARPARRHRDHRRSTTTALTRLRRDRVGFVFQSFNLLPMLTAEQNILLPLELAGRPSTAALVRRRRRRVGLRRPARATARASCPAASSSASPSPGR